MRRRPSFAVLIVALFAGIATAGCLDGGPGPDDPGDGRFATPGRPPFETGRAVVAVVDTGVNPYHLDFRDPDRTWDAETTLPGYPGAAGTLPLTLDAADMEAARAADRPYWQALETGTLYDVPGTRLVGIVGLGQPEPHPDAPLRAPGLDEAGHGTAALGMVAQACPDCLLVAVEVGAAQVDDGLAWAADQDWIDAVAVPSRGGIGFVSSGLYAVDEEADRAWGRANAEKGQVVVVASGNGPNPPGSGGAATYTPARDVSYSYWSSGPDWVVTVGAVEPVTGSGTLWHTAPVDLAAQGLDCDAPHPFSMTDRVAFEGTSCSAPVAAGWFGQVLLDLREHLRDPYTGPREGQRLVVPEDPLTEVSVTREDLTRALYLTAVDPAAQATVVHAPDPTAPERWTLGDTSLSPILTGWGVHDQTTLAAAARVLVGEADVPAPSPEEAEWFPVDQAARRLAWGPWDMGESRIPYPEPVAGDVPRRVPQSPADVEGLYRAALATDRA